MSKSETNWETQIRSTNSKTPNETLLSFLFFEHLDLFRISDLGFLDSTWRSCDIGR